MEKINLLGNHKLPNGREYKIFDSGKPYVGGEYPSGGILIAARMPKDSNAGWSHVSEAPDLDSAFLFLQAALRNSPDPGFNILGQHKLLGDRKATVEVEYGASAFSGYRILIEDAHCCLFTSQLLPTPIAAIEFLNRYWNRDSKGTPIYQIDFNKEHFNA